MTTLKVQNVTKYYGKQCVLDNISFELKQGEITGFLGGNGAGKTTTMNIITGYLKDWKGEVEIFNEDIRKTSQIIRKKVGYLPEHNPLEDQLYVKEYLEYVASLYLQKNEIKKAVDNIIEKIALGKEQHKKIGQLSKGYKQRVGLAQALIHNPRILILDEPTSGLDPIQLKTILELIKQESKDKIVLFSTHILQEAEAVCDRVLILKDGKLINDSYMHGFSQSVEIEFTEELDFLEFPFAANVQQISKHKFIISSNSTDDIRPLLFKFAKEQNLTLLTLAPFEQDLEALFRNNT